MIKKIDEIAKELSLKEFIVFAGTGVSGDTGIPMWRKLLESLLEEKPINNINVNSVEPEYFPEIVQKIYDSFENKDDYYKIIDNNLTPTMSPYSVQQFEIVTTINWIITSNFDRTFESAFNKKFEVEHLQKTLNIYSLPDFEFEDLSKEESIIYLHGMANARHIIFKKSDYEKYYPSVSGKTICAKELEDYLKYIYKNYTIVFIGLSFDDKYIRESLKNIYMDIKIADDIASEKIGYTPKLDNICHYAFLKKVLPNNNQISKELDNELKTIKIQVIRYSEHIDCIKFLKMIRDLKPHKKVSLQK